MVCAWCLPDLAAPMPARCYRCKIQASESRVCDPCRRGNRLQHVWVRASYEDDVKRLIHGFKFERKQAACEPIVRLMTEALPYFPSDTLVVHVPTATSRARQRGYDHAELIAKALAAELGLEHAPLLRRIGQARQVGSKRAERLEQLERAFRPAKSGPIEQARILLVDDLVTTGGTLQSAARALYRAGAKTVDAVVFAQKE